MYDPESLASNMLLLRGPCKRLADKEAGAAIIFLALGKYKRFQEAEDSVNITVIFNITVIVNSWVSAGNKGQC